MILRDIRGTVRLMRSQPALSAGIVLMLALGIGATTAIFSVVYGVLLKPLPFAEPERLVQVWGALPAREITRASLTEANFWDMRDLNRSLSEFGALHYDNFTLTGSGMPERVSGARVSVGFFRSLGVRCVAGRLFEPGEDDQRAPGDRALLSYGLWTTRFGSDPSIVGRTVTLDGRAYDVVGVLPAGSPWLDDADVFVPFVRRTNANRGSWEYMGIGRLAPGVSVEGALSDLQRVSKELEARFPENAGLTTAMASSRTWIASDQLRRTLWMLLGAVGLLLAIACVNVTNLLLARASARARENAVRAALGATRGDLVRERLTESMLYSAIGAVGGWVVATWMLGVLKSTSPGALPRLAEVTLNAWVLLFSATAALAVGVLTGLLPAWRTPLGNIVSSLRGGARGTTGDRGHGRLRNLFVGAEVALSLVLLVGAGLLVRSLVQVLQTDRGFQTERRLLVTVSIPRSYPETRMSQTVTDIVAGVQTLPEVVSAAAVSGQPLSRGSTGLGLGAADQAEAGSAVPWATWRIVTKDYFRTMGLPLLAGRGFTEQDVLGKPWRVVISKRAADLLWPGQDPIGRTAILWKGQSNRAGEVIGVVGNMRERGLESDPTLAVYFPAYGQLATTSLQLVIHTRGRPESVAPSIRAVVSRVDGNLPVSNIRALEEIVTASVATRRLTMLLLVTFAVVALILALAGVYGVLAYTVARRSSEIGLRIALGADHQGVLRLVVAQGMRPVLVGAAIGLAGAFWTSRLMASLLYQIAPYDPATYAIAAAALIAVAAVACYVPARRVLRVDPAFALRTE